MIDVIIGFLIGFFAGGFAVVMMSAIILYRIINGENLKEER